MFPASLPDLDGLDLDALKALVIVQHSQLLEQDKSNTEQIEHLKLVIEKYRRMIFGRKSEKLTGQLEQLELRLEELETAQAAEEAAQASAEAGQTASAPATSERRRRPARKPLPENLPREVVNHLPPHTCCPDRGGALRQFGEDVSEQLERIPATFKVIRHVRPKFACAGMLCLGFSGVGISEKPGNARAGCHRRRIRARPTTIPLYRKKSQVQLVQRGQRT